MKEQGKFKELEILGFNESGEWMLNFKKLILKLNKNVET